MRSKIKNCFNDEEIKEIKENVEYLKKHPETDFIESGYFGVKQEHVGDQICFSIYRIVGEIWEKERKLKN